MESEPNEFTRFTITIRLNNQRNNATMAIKILSVDDELDLEILLTQYFGAK